MKQQLTDGRANEADAGPRNDKKHVLAQKSAGHQTKETITRIDQLTELITHSLAKGQSGRYRGSWCIEKARIEGDCPEGNRKGAFELEKATLNFRHLRSVLLAEKRQI
jgi:hypothetical protein